MNIRSAERIAIVGPSGCGKSTLARLVIRLYEPQRGGILIDGVALSEISLKELRTQVCYVPQRAKLFNDTLKNNLLLGNLQARPSEIERAIEISGLLPVIAKLPESLSQNLGPAGELLSGGERQRVAIARAILRRPRLLILDESTSEIDSVVEQAIFERLHQYLLDTTIVAITHRLTALRWVDRIHVLDDGEVVMAGTHDDLYRTSRLYSIMYDQKQSDILNEEGASVDV